MDLFNFSTLLYLSPFVHFIFAIIIINQIFIIKKIKIISKEKEINLRNLIN